MMVRQRPALLLLQKKNKGQAGMRNDAVVVDMFAGHNLILPCQFCLFQNTKRPRAFINSLTAWFLSGLSTRFYVWVERRDVLKMGIIRPWATGRRFASRACMRGHIPCAIFVSRLFVSSGWNANELMLTGEHGRVELSNGNSHLTNCSIM